MIRLAELDSCKALAEVMADVFPGGIMFWWVDGNTVVWTKKSAAFGLDIVNIGDTLGDHYASMQAVREKRVLVNSVARENYGKRIVMITIPVLDEEDQPVGAFNIALPKLHPVAAAFGDFAPIMSEMFHEGALLYMSDLHSIAYRQASQKFDIPSVPLGYMLQKDDIATKTIETKEKQYVEIGSEKYGMPVSITNCPIFDEENPEEIVATLGVITPKKTAAQLRDISGNLADGFSSISAAMEELAASAMSIHSNEQVLHGNIQEIIALSEEINNVSLFIKEIADETKMLGLNAAIEAARAGDAGRGFGIVAEEIRKLSEQSKSTVPTIQKLTQSIKAKVEDASVKSKHSLHSSQEQAAATEEITASIEEITAMSEELNKIALTL